MVRINWQAAVSYCEWLTAKAREQGLLLDGYECALPTEAQWEYACRALPSREPGTPFYYGEDLSYETLPNYAWYSLNSAGTTQRVAQKLPNAWGLHDMSGNVWEWCADWYADQYPGGNVTDPEGPVSGMERILRGGSYLFDARSSRSAIRFRQGPLDAGNDRGFTRCCAQAFQLKSSDFDKTGFVHLLHRYLFLGCESTGGSVISSACWQDA
jgi:formylglycine-generating enzyme required for sulfatase activity